MNILILSHKFSPFIGGIEVMSQEIANYLSHSGYNIHVLTWTENKEIDSYPYKIIRNPSILKILKEHHWADLVFENNTNLRLSWPLLFFKKLHLNVIHGQICRNDRSISFIDKLKLRWIHRANKVIAVSQAMKSQVFPKALVVHNYYRDYIFKENSNNRDEMSFVFLGRIVSVKGVDIALKTIAKLNKQNHLNCTLTVIGNGPLLEEMRNLSIELEIDHITHFTGMLSGENLVNVLNNNKYILIPSTQESFGLVALEGMACGCLPIVSNVDGLPEAVGAAGFVVVDYKNIDGFYNAITFLLDNPQKEACYRSQFNKHLEKFKLDSVCQKYKEVIESIIK